MKLKVTTGLPTSYRCLIIGPSNCGKTYLLMNDILLAKEEQLKGNLMLFSASLHQPYYQLLQKCFENKFSHDLVCNIFNVCKAPYKELDEFIEQIKGEEDFQTHIDCDDLYCIFSTELDELPDPSELSSEEKNLVIFDDLIDEKQAQLSKYFTRGRHNNINVIYISQSYFHLPRKTIRNNSNFIILFKLQTRDVENIYRDLVSCDMPIKEFKDLCKLAWSREYGYLIIDLTSDPDVGKYRISWNEFYLPKGGEV